jgi:hypothetical protein
VKQLFYDGFGQLLGRMLGLDGCLTLALLGFAMWCGHYALRGRRTRPAEILVLGPVCLSSFALAGLICEGTVKFLALAALALMAYVATVKAGGVNRSGG